MQQDVLLSGVTLHRLHHTQLNEKGQGPAWSNSLFEDNAEFGYGMLLAQKALRNGLKEKVEKLVESGDNEAVVAAGKEWLETFNCGATNGTATDNLSCSIRSLWTVDVN